MGVVRLLEYSLRLRNSFTQHPFRYGNGVLSACPQALVQATLEYNGKIVQGYASDCLPPLWFDKSSDIPYSRQIDDMCETIIHTRQLLDGHRSFDNALDLSLALESAPQRIVPENKLLASFGKSMLERSVIDACCRAEAAAFGDLVVNGILCDDRQISSTLASGRSVNTSLWSQDSRSASIFIRHTVGMLDKIWDDNTRDQAVSLQLEIRKSNLRFFKIKIANRDDEDVDRIVQIAKCIEMERGIEYGVTLDGNEQFSCFEEFLELFSKIKAIPALQNFCANVIAIEQPVSRQHALDNTYLVGLSQFALQTPVIIDESDEHWSSFFQAIELGYTGTSSKACKGVFKSMFNRQIIEENNLSLGDAKYVMTGEDLCCIGPVSLHADLALVSFLGLEHVERNGHHYFHGLEYLPQHCYADVFNKHHDLYMNVEGIPCLKINAGSISLASINTNAFGSAVVPAWDCFFAPEDWDFNTLGID